MTTNELASLLEKAIRTRKYPSGVQLPSEETLAREHSVSTRIVREALAQLVGKKLIEKRRGVRATVK
jgi:DNA-binding FadR family transcriptional regulator